MEELALRKQLLVARSSLYRLKIRHETGVLRESLSWRHAAVAAASSSPARTAAFLLALEGLGKGRTARLLAFASRALMVARFVRTALSLLRSPPAGPAES
jgi:hypothetical protein